MLPSILKPFCLCLPPHPDQFRQFKVEQLKAMMENQDFFTYKVREMEGIIRSGSAKQAQPPPVAALPAPVAR